MSKARDIAAIALTAAFLLILAAGGTALAIFATDWLNHGLIPTIYR